MSETPDRSGVRGGWPVRIGDILAPSLERLGPKGVWTEAKLRKAWKDAVGEQIATHAHPRRLRGSVLDVSVTSDSWATELTYMAGSLVERLNAVLGAGTVTQIVVSRQRQDRRYGAEERRFRKRRNEPG
jgi:predicted nucleic acid-binding Zn ribbon protein